MKLSVLRMFPSLINWRFSISISIYIYIYLFITEVPGLGPSGPHRFPGTGCTSLVPRPSGPDRFSGTSCTSLVPALMARRGFWALTVPAWCPPEVVKNEHQKGIHGRPWSFLGCIGVPWGSRWVPWVFWGQASFGNLLKFSFQPESIHYINGILGSGASGG